MNRKIKAIRSRVILRWCLQAGYSRIVCFSCGNAVDALLAEQAGRPKYAHMQIIGVSPRHELQAGKWFTTAEVVRTFGADAFDATPGHLAGPLLAMIAQEAQATFDNIKPGETYFVPAGSGETVVVLAMAFSNSFFIAEYDDNDPATTYSPDAPLNTLVQAVCHNRIHHTKRRVMQSGDGLAADIAAEYADNPVTPAPFKDDRPLHERIPHPEDLPEGCKPEECGISCRTCYYTPPAGPCLQNGA